MKRCQTRAFGSVYPHVFVVVPGWCKASRLHTCFDQRSLLLTMLKFLATGSVGSEVPEMTGIVDLCIIPLD